jgi:hypothetical protein
MRLGDSNYKDKYYGSSVNENNQTDETPGLGIVSRSYGGSSYQQSPAWDTNQGSTGTRAPLGLPGWNDRQPVNGEDNPGRPSVLKGIASSPKSVAPQSPIGVSSSDYSAPDEGKRGGPEGTISSPTPSNPSLPQNNENYQTTGPTLAPEGMDAEQYLTFLFGRESINHNYKGKG